MADRKPLETVPAPDQIQDAVDRVIQQGHERVAARIPMLTQPHTWKADSTVTITAPDDPEKPVMLLWDEAEQAFRVIILEPGTEWEIRAKAPTIWQPGRPS